MRFVVDFDRYPTAICVMVIEYMRGDGYMRIETPCSDKYLRWLYLQGFDVPEFWLQWNETKKWIEEQKSDAKLLAA